MRFKIKLTLKSLPIKDVAEKTASVLNKILGDNHKWHDLESKPYTCSLILGGKKHDESLIFENGGYFYINTNDNEVINALLNNKGIEFSVENNKLNSGYNLLSVKRVIYNTNGKKIWVTNDNKHNFENYVKVKYGVNIEILKINNTTIHYKNNTILDVSDLLIKCNDKKNVNNLFETGIGGSCSIGFGFVETLNK